MKNNEKRKFASLDAVLLLIIISAILCLGVRIITGENGLFPNDVSAPGDYILRISHKGSPVIFQNCMETGNDILLTGGEILGKVFETGKTDAAVTVSGVMTDSGFMLNGNVFLAPNMDIEVRSSDNKSSVAVTVTDILPADTSDN